MVVVSHSRFGAIAALGVIGFEVMLTYLVNEASDVAMIPIIVDDPQIDNLRAGVLSHADHVQPRDVFLRSYGRFRRQQRKRLRAELCQGSGIDDCLR